MGMNEDSINKVIAELRFGFSGVVKDMETIEALANKTALKVQETFAKTQLTSGGMNTQQMTAQQAMVQQIQRQGEARKAAIVAEGEAKISAIQAKEALTRQQIAQKEAATQLAILKQQMAQEKMLYMQVRREAFEEKPQGFAGLMERRASWLLTGGLVMGGIAGITETISTIKDVEFGMTTIARVTEDAAFSFKGMRDELQQLGVTYGDTWDDVSDIAIRWAQAGYDMNDTLKLTRDSLLALNTAELNSEQATNGLIAVMAQWGLTADELLPVIDKINKVADDFAITSTDLVAGLQRSSGAAKVLGLTMEETIAILTTMREATGRTGKEVGNALNSILSFMQRPTAIKAFEVEGIRVFADEARTQFRNVIEIFDEMAQKWPQMGKASRDAFVEQAEAAGLYSEEMAEVMGMEEQYNDIQQRNLSQAAAGIYRRNYLLALLQNWSKVDEVLISQENALGYSMKENERTMQTLEKQIEVLRASAEQLAVALGDAGLLREITGLVEGVTDVVQWFNNLDDSTQTMLLTLAEITVAIKLLNAAFKGLGISGAMAGAGGLMAGWAVPIGATTMATRGLMSALTAVTTLLSNIGKGILAAFGGPVVASIIGVGTALVTIARNTARINEELIAHGEIAENLIGEYDKLSNKLDDLTKGTDEHKRTVEELSDLKDQIANSLPEVIDGWDSETDSVIVNRTEMERLINTSEELKKSQEDLTESVENSIKAMEAEVAEHTKQAQNWESEKNVLQDLVERRDELTEALSRQKEGSEESIRVQEALGETERLIADIAQEAGLSRNATVDEIIAKLNELKVAENQAVINTQTAELNKVKTVKEGALARLRVIEQEIAAYGNPMEWGFFESTGNFLKTMFGKKPLLSELKKEKVETVKAAQEAKAQIESIEKSIKQSQRNIADINADIATGGNSLPLPGISSGSTGSGKPYDWSQYIENVLAATEAQSVLNEQSQRAIDIMDAKNSFYQDSAMTMAEYIKGMQDEANMGAVLERQQESLHTEANLYREAIALLEAKQNSLNTSTEKGSDAYRKIGDEIANAKQKVDELGQGWLELEKRQRMLYSNKVEDITGWFDNLVEIGELTNRQELEKLALMDMQKMTLSGQYEYTKKISDLLQNEANNYIDKQVAASESRIASIQAEIDALDEENDALEEQKQIQEALDSMNEARSDLADAKTKLANVQNEKNTRIFQNGVWGYIADPQAVKEAQKEVKDANQRLIDARQNYYDTLEQIDQKHYKAELQAQIEAEKEKQDALKESFKDMENLIIEGGPKLQEALKTIFVENITPEFEGRLNSLLSMVRSKSNAMKSAIEDALMSMGNLDGASLPQYGAGGPIPQDMVIQAHANEWMLNAQDVRLLGGYSGVQNMLASLRFPKAISASSIVKNNTSVSSPYIDKRVMIDKASFPQVVDGSGLIRNLRQMAG